MKNVLFQSLDAGKNHKENVPTETDAAECLLVEDKSQEEASLKFEQSSSAEDVMADTLTASALASVS